MNEIFIHAKMVHLVNRIDLLEKNITKLLSEMGQIKHEHPQQEQLIGQKLPIPPWLISSYFIINLFLLIALLVICAK